MTQSVDQDQCAVFAFLQNPATHQLSVSVTRIDTHGAAVFLAGANVYKVKRAVRFAFMDFSTLEKRRSACEAEITVNRDNAPGLYLGVVPITRKDAGLHLGGDGQVVEWAVHLRRFDENATLDRLADKGPLGAEVIDKLALAVVAAHARAPLRDGRGATRILGRLLKETVDELACAPDIFPPDRVAVFGQSLTAAFDQAQSVLNRRGDQGQVRRCHGDLHLGNVALIDGAPVLFDAIEFDEAIATCDILYDLAFLVMDLCERGLRSDANRLFNRYLAAADDEQTQIEGLSAWPLFLSLRAAIRAKVTAALVHLDAMGAGLDAAQGYFDTAIQSLMPVPPSLIAVGGLSGTGKTTLAVAMAPAFGRVPGALHLRSDLERKRLFGVAETTRLPATAYRPDVSARVYERLNGLAEKALCAGQAVVVDATHQSPKEREAIAATAARAGISFFGLWLEAPIEVLARRVTERRADASDAVSAVVAAQAATAIGAVEWRRLDASRSLDTLKVEALSLVRPCDGPAPD